MRLFASGGEVVVTGNGIWKIFQNLFDSDPRLQL